MLLCLLLGLRGRRGGQDWLAQYSPVESRACIVGGQSLNMGSLRQELHILPPHYPPQEDDEDDWGMEDDVMMMGSTPKVRSLYQTKCIRL